MAKNNLLELETYRRKVATLERKIKKELAKKQRKLVSLPGKHGFRTVGDLIKALRAAVKAAGAEFGKAKAKRKRAKITPEIRAKVKALATSGKTGAQIAKQTGISVPSVQNIKKALGLVKGRK